MCVLCERAAAARLELQGMAGVGTALALGDALLPSNLLIDSANVAFSKGRVASDGVMDLYLHAPGGAVQVSGGGFGGQTIESVPIPQQDQDYIRSIVSRLDAIIDLDFRFVADPGQADVAFYYDTEIDIGGGGQTLGLATKGSAGWELFVNQPAVASNQDYRQYVNLHEWGHALGLEHPFEAGDGDVYAGNTNPWTSAYPEETVMAYRRPLNGEWPDFFTPNDLNALIAIWGVESSYVAPVPPVDGPDLTGRSLQLYGVGDDVITGSAFNDWLNGGRGRDQISGGDGDDLLRGGKDADVINGNAGDDWVYGDLGDDILRGGKGNDWIDGGDGNDEIWGDLGADRIRLSRGNDVVWGFSFDEGDRLEISEGLGYSLLELDGNIELASGLGVTVFMGIAGAEEVENAVVFV
jgi:serralysin